MKKTIKLDEIELEIRKIPLGRYAELIRVIKKLPAKFQTMDNFEQKNLVEKIPEIIETASGDLLEIIALAIDTPVSVLYTNELGLHELVRIIEAIFEVNHYDEVYQIIKKALDHPVMKEFSEKTTSIVS